MPYQQLYDNDAGYKNESINLESKIKRFFQNIIEEYSEYNALELLGLACSAITNAFHEVSIKRRLSHDEPST